MNAEILPRIVAESDEL